MWYKYEEHILSAVCLLAPRLLFDSFSCAMVLLIQSVRFSSSFAFLLLLLSSSFRFKLWTILNGKRVKWRKENIRYGTHTCVCMIDAVLSEMPSGRMCMECCTECALMERCRRWYFCHGQRRRRRLPPPGCLARLFLLWLMFAMLYTKLDNMCAHVVGIAFILLLLLLLWYRLFTDVRACAGPSARTLISVVAQDQISSNESQ